MIMARDMDRQRQIARRTAFGLVVAAVLVYLSFILLSALNRGVL